jgi:hypothetical protein
MLLEGLSILAREQFQRLEFAQQPPVFKCSRLKFGQ